MEKVYFKYYDLFLREFTIANQDIGLQRTEFKIKATGSPRSSPERWKWAEPESLSDYKYPTNSGINEISIEK